MITSGVAATQAAGSNGNPHGPPWPDFLGNLALVSHSTQRNYIQPLYRSCVSSRDILGGRTRYCRRSSGAKALRVRPREPSAPRARAGRMTTMSSPSNDRLAGPEIIVEGRILCSQQSWNVTRLTTRQPELDTQGVAPNGKVHRVPVCKDLGEAR